MQRQLFTTVVTASISYLFILGVRGKVLATGAHRGGLCEERPGTALCQAHHRAQLSPSATGGRPGDSASKKGQNAAQR